MSLAGVFIALAAINNVVFYVLNFTQNCII